MRHIFQSVFKDGQGRIIPSATVSVYLAGTVTTANVYQNATGGSPVTSVTTASDGSFSFFVSDSDFSLNQKFKITMTKTDFATKSYDNITIFAPVPTGVYYPDANATDQGAATTGGYSLKDIIDAAGSNNITIKFRNSSGSATTSYTLTTSETIPANCSIEFEIGARIAQGGSAVLTINGSIVSDPMHQIFSGFLAGEVVFGYGAVRFILPEWWGAVANGSTNNAVAIQCAIDSIVGGRVLCGLGTYNFVGPLQMRDNIVFEGLAVSNFGIVQGTRLHNTGTAGQTAISIGSAVRRATVRMMQITGNVSSGYGIDWNGANYTTLEDLMVGDYQESQGRGHGSDGVRVTGAAYYAHINRVTSRGNYGRGFSFATGANTIWITQFQAQGNALDGVYVSSCYALNFSNGDITINGSGAPSSTIPNVGTAGYGISIAGTCHGMNFEHINYEENANGNEIHHNLTSSYGPVQYSDIVGDGQDYNILMGNDVTIENLKGNSKTIAFASGTNYCKVIGCETQTTITNSGGSQNITIDADSIKHFDGAVVSAAALTLGKGRVFAVSGTADITSIQSADTYAGREIILIFTGTAATNGVVDGSNLKLAGNFSYTPDDTLSLVCNGTNWYETGRSVN